MLINWDFPYPSQRMPVFARNVVATSQPLASQAGLLMLLRGGNAIDAALAAAIALTVLEPTGNGIGSDAFAMVWDGQKLHGLNGSGRSPRAFSPEHFRGKAAMPQLGWDAVTVPGAVDAWAELSRRFGALPFSDLFEPALRLARDGFPVAPVTAARWAEVADLYNDYPDFVTTFLPGGRAPFPGETFHPPGLAETLEELAKTGGESLYRGNLARKIISCSRNNGGLLDERDLAEHHAQWVVPLCQNWKNVALCELPPNAQGMAVLIALGILENTPPELSECIFAPDSPESIHLQVEAMKIAFELVEKHLADSDWMTIQPSSLLEPSFLKEQEGKISIGQTRPSSSLPPRDGGTVYLTAADKNGMMVSYIQSNYKAFGSGIVIPETGISMQGRAAGFTLAAGHPNQVAGGKRPFHTIIPAFVMKEGKPLLSFGVMGARMQPQGHLQMMIRIFAAGQNPQTAADAPRWYLDEYSNLFLESGVSPATSEGLKKRGHKVYCDSPARLFGGAQLIYRLEECYCAASDPRKDGQAVGF
ncbi:MAG: gamma-glutamyltransferase family protein [Syntrophobacterales bacterium]|nr:gamma-glutamyltransferase family protein [Syntrophobacterales bacterium]